MKRSAPAFNVLLSGARHRLTPLYSNYFSWLWGEREAEAEGNPITPAVPGSRTQGRQS